MRSYRPGFPPGRSAGDAGLAGARDKKKCRENIHDKRKKETEAMNDAIIAVAGGRAGDAGIEEQV